MSRLFIGKKQFFCQNAGFFYVLYGGLRKNMSKTARLPTKKRKFNYDFFKRRPSPAKHPRNARKGGFAVFFFVQRQTKSGTNLKSYKFVNFTLKNLGDFADW